MIKRLLLERAKHHGLPMVAAELDWMKACGSVDRWVKEMTLRRLGLQYDFIDFLLSSNRRNEQRVRTYYGDSEACACERGACMSPGRSRKLLRFPRSDGLDASGWPFGRGA
jgi:hypothetical protein